MSDRNVCGWRALCNACEWGTRTCAEGFPGRSLIETAASTHTSETGHTIALYGFRWTNGRGDWTPEPLRREAIAR